MCWIAPCAKLSQEPWTSVQTSKYSTLATDRPKERRQCQANLTRCMDERAILNCQITSWYSSFERVTYRTRLIELPHAFVEYLLQDGVYLPEESAAVLPSFK